MNPTTPRRLAGIALAAAAVLAAAACSSSTSTAKTLPTGALSSARSQASAALSSVAAAASSAASSAAAALPSLPSLPAGGTSTEFQACTLTIGLATSYASGADVTAQLNAAAAARDKLAEGTLRTQVAAVIDAVRAKDVAAVGTTGKALADSCRSVILGATSN